MKSLPKPPPNVYSMDTEEVAVGGAEEGAVA